jgi:protein DJ-1
MPSALILLADGSEETEFVTTYDILIRAGIDTKSCGVNLKSDYAV